MQDVIKMNCYVTVSRRRREQRVCSLLRMAVRVSNDEDPIVRAKQLKSAPDSSHSTEITNSLTEK